MPNQSNLDSLQALIEGKDQRFINGIFVPIANPITGRSKVYFEKRPGLEIADIGDCEGLIAPGCDATALHFSRAMNKYVVALCDDIYVNCTAIGDTNPDEEPEIVSTFWNPLDAYGVTLSNDNYTVTINSHGDDDSTQPYAALENTALFIGSTKYYWEIEIEACTSNGNQPTLSFGFLDRFDGPGFIGGAVNSPNYDDKDVRASAEASLTDLKPDGFFWHSNAGAISPRALLVALGGNPTAHVAVTTTGVSGFETGDILMFAHDRAAGKMWWGKNGTWFNSGDPAAGTNPQVTNLTEPSYSGGNDPQWRLVLATSNYPYASAEVIVNGAFGNSTFPQTYSAPTGFSSNLPRSTEDFFAGWSTRGSNNKWLFSAADLQAISTPGATGGWYNQGTLDLNDSSVVASSVAVLQAGGKYYFELEPDLANNIALGICLFGQVSQTADSGTLARWRGDNSTLDQGGGASPITVHTTGVSTFAANDTLMFAVDLANGLMWVGKNGTWTNSGDPAAGTNYQFSSIPTDQKFIISCLIISNARRVMMFHPDDHAYSAPTGFTNGVPVTNA
jgi:hypothetical protein